MKFFLSIIIMMSFMVAKAQLSEGHYSFVKKEDIKSKEVVYASEESCSFSKLFETSYCINLDVSENNIIYLQIKRSFNTGNTVSANSGYYLTALTLIENNYYIAKNKLISLSLEVNKNNDIEILVHNRVENLFCRGIFNRLEDIYLEENIKYFFKKENSIPRIPLLKDDIFGTLGVNYGAYKIMKDKIIWEDITNWASKEETILEKVDIETFEVCKYINNFYLIVKSAQQVFPKGYTDYAKDKNYVYYQGNIIDSLNPSGFQIVDPLHIKTDINVYYKNELMSNADVATFESLNGGYAMDKNNYYNKGVIVDRRIKKLLKIKERIFN